MLGPAEWKLHCRTPPWPPSPPPCSVFWRPSPPPAGRLLSTQASTQSQGPCSPRRPQTTSFWRITPRPCSRRQWEKLHWNRAGPAGARRVIYDPDQLFRKQKLTWGGLGGSFEVHGFVFLQHSPSIKQFLLFSTCLLFLPTSLGSLFTPFLSPSNPSCKDFHNFK